MGAVQGTRLALVQLGSLVEALALSVRRAPLSHAFDSGLIAFILRRPKAFVQDRNNQRYLFEKMLEVLAEGLLRRPKKQANSETANAATVSLNFKKQNAPRYSKKKRAQ